jgi:uncharacterized protein (DUF1810 family)
MESSWSIGARVPQIPGEQARKTGPDLMSQTAVLKVCRHVICDPVPHAGVTYLWTNRSGPMTDPFDLQRFVDAQAPVYQQVLAELGHGQKRSHWMWFIFPQFVGLGFSPMARRFAIASREEAVAYLGHGVLGSRLRECTALVNAVRGRTLIEIFGSPDDLKFASSMTLFSAVSSDPEFAAAIATFCDGGPDQKTLELLSG